MRYVVVDLEWNQAMSSKSSIFNRLPIHLRGEIIQIGAVKLNASFEPEEEFQVDIKPIYFRKIHHKVKKLTGFDKDRLSGGEAFSPAIESFLSWCGPNCAFLTWGYDDKGIMEQNLIIHDLDIDWLGKWINLQIIFNLQVEGSSNQKSLSFAMEHFGIEQTRTAHDALGDAFNTAMICSRLDLESGLEQYDDATRILALRGAKKSEEVEAMPIEHRSYGQYRTREDCWRDEKLSEFLCPICQKELAHTKWVSQGDRRYMSLAECEKHGSFLLRLRLKREPDELWTANRIVYSATEEMLIYYKKKLKQPGRSRRRSPKKKS